jgi:phosphoribosylamine--glycine ligase
MRILLLGSGGREHALAFSIKKSTLCEKLFIAPGNAGTVEFGENLNISVTDFEGIRTAVLSNKINLVVVGPEEPLVKGIVDYFQKDAELKSVLIVGPGAIGAQLEGSKDFAKAFMQRHKIPTAAYKTFNKSQVDDAKQFLNTLKPPYVLKADGLAAGKGVIISSDIEETKRSIDSMLTQSMFGKASEKLVIEEFLDGIELSVFVLTDGNDYVILPEAKDYKRIGEGDTGPNTGGMGAVSPVPFADEAFMKKVEERIIKQTVNGFKKENIYYRGFVFIGLMKVGDDPFVIEYNVRMGDPETEVVFPRIKSDVVKIFSDVASGKITNQIDVDPRTAVTVMLVSEGYPGNYEKKKPITIKDTANSIIFHAGTMTEDRQLLSNGGRVIAVTSFGNSIEDASKKSYEQINSIDYSNKNFRKDIGSDLLQFEKSKHSKISH